MVELLCHRVCVYLLFRKWPDLFKIVILFYTVSTTHKGEFQFFHIFPNMKKILCCNLHIPYDYHTYYLYITMCESSVRISALLKSRTVTVQVFLCARYRNDFLYKGNVVKFVL